MSSPPVTVTAEHLLSSSRYRHPGDVIRLISAGLVLACSLAVSWIARRWLLGTAAAVPDDLGPADGVVTGLVQVAFLVAVVVVVAATLRKRRLRLLAGLAAGAVVAALLAEGIFLLLGAPRPAALTTDLARGSWVAGAAFPAPALFASAAAVAVGAAPWLSRAWRRVAWLTLLLAGVVRILAGTMLPMELVLALAAGVTVGAAVLVAFGVPDQRIGPAGIAAALRDAGLPVTSVRPVEVEGKGSRKFTAVSADGRRLFVKALGSDQRDADLLYRAYRAVRLRNVGDTRPAATLFQAVEHQGMAGVMAERAGVLVPGVDRVIKAGGDTALLVLDWVDGGPLEQLPAGQIGEDLLARLWAEVDKLHRARIAHRSLHASNVLVDPDGQPVIAGFSFSELSATRRQESAQWAWVLVAIGFSALTYPASAAGLLGGVAARVPFWPAVLTQGASSYVNRVSPANVGGMALNARFLQKAGVEPTAGVAAVGVNSLAGALVHLVLLVIFFAWAGRGGAGQAFKLPAEQHAAGRPGGRGRGHRHRDRHPPGPQFRGPQGAAPAAVIAGQPGAGGAEPGQADHAVRRLGRDHPGQRRRPGRLG